jgi:cytoskeletal protein CcmA (bactofilin family)
MFRARKDQGGEDPNRTHGEARVISGDSSPLKRPPRRQFQVPAEPSSGAVFHPDIPRRPMDAPRAPKRLGERSSGIVDSNSLVVGREIMLKGEITSCEQIIVEGQIEVALTDARRIQVGPTGVFRGKADIEEADISGRFEGELTVRERLTVRATGRVDGKIRYGCIIIEAGGEIAGEVQAISPDDQRGDMVRTLPRVAEDTSADVSRNTSEILEHELEASRD